MRRRLGSSLAVLALLSGPAALAAQERAESADSPRAGPSPRGALVRSLLVPGWGQAAAGAYLRGGVYFAAQAGSGFMVWMTTARIGEARDIRDRASAAARAELLARAETDTAWARVLSENPDTLAALVRATPFVAHQQRLMDARGEQREDWITWLVFWTFASAIDAFVAAQLADFPAGLSVVPRADGAVAVALQIRIPRSP